MVPKIPNNAQNVIRLLYSVISMELLCALLTGFLFWLFIHQWSSFARKRTIQNAGSLLLEVKFPYRTRIIFIVVSLFPFLVILSLLVFFWRKTANYPIIFHFPIISLWCKIYIALMEFTLFAAIEVFVRKNSFEIREHGIVKDVFFITWDRIRYCRWAKSKRKLFLHYPYFPIRLKSAPDEYESVTETLSKFVEVRDSASNFITGPQKICNQAVRRDSIWDWIKRRFCIQYDLLTLLIFILFCASVFSWYGIIHRRSRQQDTALEKLDRFHPEIVRSIDVIFLWFSDEKNKPEDGDLIYFEPFSELQDLSLDMAPITDKGLLNLKPLSQLSTLNIMRTKITDNGLEHLTSLPQLRELILLQDNITDAGIVYLKKMKNLKVLNIQDTKITPQGIKELQKALPNTEIVISSPSPPSSTETNQ